MARRHTWVIAVKPWNGTWLPTLFIYETFSLVADPFTFVHATFQHSITGKAARDVSEITRNIAAQLKHRKTK